MSDVFREPVSLSDSDSRWPQQYEAEAVRIGETLTGRTATIEHIGSTSIPLRGKPIIDIQVAVAEPVRAYAIAALERLGYDHHGEGGIAGRAYLTSRPGTAPWFNVHLFGAQSSLLSDNRLIRDYLRTHPQAAREYVESKERALAQGHDDLASYSHAKASVLAAIREAACRWARRTRE